MSAFGLGGGHGARRGHSGRRVPRRVCHPVTVFAWSGLASLAACMPRPGGWFSLGPAPAAIAGQWVDVARSSPTDTVVWMLQADGLERTLHVHVRTGGDGQPIVATERRARRYWYLAGGLADRVGRRLCFKARARDGPTCVAFRLDTLAHDATAGAVGKAATRRTLRRLTIRGGHDDASGARVYMERP